MSCWADAKPPSSTPRCGDGHNEGEHEKLSSQPLTLDRGVERELGQEDRRYLLRCSSGQPPRGVVPSEQVGCDREVADDRTGIVDKQIGAGALACRRACVSSKPLVELGVPAVERREVVIAERLDVARHRAVIRAFRRERFAASAR